jgi:hypothetical protein
MSPFFEFALTGDGAFDPAAVAAACMEHDAQGVLLDEGALPAAFFDLRTGLAGELAQRLTLYGIRMAAVVPDPAAHAPSFQAFAREANRGRHLRFAPTREAAVRWLEVGAAG